MQSPRSIRASGFTLTEVMITVAIVAILASIAYPSYRKQIMQSNRTDARTALLQLQVAQEKFFLQYNRYAGGTTAAASVTELNNLPSASPPGLGIPTNTTHNYYAVTLVTDTSTTYTATATAIGSQLGDTDCRTFVITQARAQTSRNSAGAVTTSCWK